ncbi:MAG: response regulator transcription factor [Micavibrio sp.]|nr:response regulator transcription factor [Micavibrio sp.]
MRILLVEDNASLADAIKDSLYKAGFEVDAVLEGEEALAAALHQTYDALVLDLGLPDMDGMDVLQKIRAAKNAVPVLVLTARDALSDKIEGLNSGADDYMVKPFEVGELIARLKALLRRPAQAVAPVLTLDNLSFDTNTRVTEIDGKMIDLSRREVDLLEQLIQSAGKIVTKKSIEQRMYSYGETGSANSIEVLVHRLRKKLQSHAAGVEIHTLKGIGYMMSEGAPKDPVKDGGRDADGE